MSFIELHDRSSECKVFLNTAHIVLVFQALTVEKVSLPCSVFTTGDEEHPWRVEETYEQVLDKIRRAK